MHYKKDHYSLIIIPHPDPHADWYNKDGIVHYKDFQNYNVLISIPDDCFYLNKLF